MWEPRRAEGREPRKDRRDLREDARQSRGKRAERREKRGPTRRANPFFGHAAPCLNLWRPHVGIEGRGKKAEKRGKRAEKIKKSEERRERREVERNTWQGGMAKKRVGP